MFINCNKFDKKGGKDFIEKRQGTFYSLWKILSGGVLHNQNQVVKNDF